ncbi:phosphoglycolate phosphatase [Lachnospiraceae bacterium PF1-21]|uniref:HAD family hydrolase n=1 Tax=Ohessyouella blattaphilus TaxID=2949333 RepID=UPI003E2A93BC
MKACIFDLDGTLADTMESLTYSVGLTLEKLGLNPISDEQCRSFVGEGAKVLIERAVTAGGGSVSQYLPEALGIYKEIFASHCTYHVRAYTGITEMAKELKKRGYKLGVLSNKPHEQAMKVMWTLFPDGLFERVYGQRDEVPRKPDPAGVWQILEELEVARENCFYIGDSDVDLLTGTNADVATLLVTWGFRSETELIEAGGKLLFHSPAELLKYLK